MNTDNRAETFEISCRI